MLSLSWLFDREVREQHRCERWAVAQANRIASLKVQLAIAGEIIEARDDELAKLAQRCGRLQDDLDSYRRFFATTVPDPFETS